MWAAKRHVSLASVVVGRESACGRQNNILRRVSKAPVLTKNVFSVCELEIAGGVGEVSSFPPMHLVGLPIYGTSVMCEGPTFDHSARHEPAIPALQVLES